MIASELWRAYSETHYIVDAVPPFALHIGKLSPELDALLASSRCESAAFITAWNPDSVALPLPENERRQSELIEDLRQRGLKVVSGRGHHPSNGWEPEESLLVLGLQMEAARVLCKKYGQLAFVTAQLGGRAELVETAAA